MSGHRETMPSLVSVGLKTGSKLPVTERRQATPLRIVACGLRPRLSHHHDLSSNPHFPHSAATLCMIDWLRLFPDEDFRFHMALRRGDAAGFFCSSDRTDSLLEMRVAALDTHPHRYAAALADARPMVEEAVGHIAKWSRSIAPHESGDLLEFCIAAGKTLEPDWVLLSPDSAANHPVVAGVVCFPSSWSLPEKLGLPIGAVHQPAPTVNNSLARSISTFLERLNPGEAWEREFRAQRQDRARSEPEHWGLSAIDALDHHPQVIVPPLTEEATPSTTWLRLESQILIRLPATGAILFGIRVTVHRLDALAGIPGLAPRIARALQPMPEDISVYKGLARCREALAKALHKT